MPRARSAATRRRSIASGIAAYSAATAGSRRTAVTCGSSSARASRRSIASPVLASVRPSAATIRDSAASSDASLSLGLIRMGSTAGDDMAKLCDGTSASKGDQEAKARLARERARLAPPRASVAARVRVHGHDAAQADQANEVGKDLQRIHEVAPGPHYLRLEGCADRNEQAVHPPIWQRHAAPEDVLEELLAVVRPSDERRVAEKKGAHRHDPAAESRHGRIESPGDGGRARGEV